MEIEQDIKRLFQDYCAHYEMVYHLSALNAQIYTYIMFNNHREGVTFDEIVEKLCASKSSISSGINILLTEQKIEYFNKMNERKRFFRLNRNFMAKRLEYVHQFLSKDKELTTRLQDLLVNDKLKINSKQKIEIYLEHLNSELDLLKDTIDKLKKQ